MRGGRGVALLLLLACAPSAHAAPYCGSVFAAGSPVRGAHVVAVESGAVASSDTTGRFCFADLSGSTVTLRVFAIGFAPEERLITLGSSASPLRVELVPLRGGGGWNAGGGSATPASPGPSADRTSIAGGTASVAAPAALADTLTDLDAGGLGVPLLYLPADSVWIRSTKKKGKAWEQLNELRHALHEAPEEADAAGRAKAWRSIAGQARDLRLHWCNDERPVRNALPDATCDYLDRAHATAVVRAAVSDGKSSIDRETRLYLERRLQSAVPAEAAWAAETLKRAAAQP